MSDSNIVIVSRHAAAIEWLAQQGITGTVISGNATPEDVAGKVVVGNLPLHLSALTQKVGSIDLPGLRRDQRGGDLSVEEMVAAGAVVRWYAVVDCAASAEVAAQMEERAVEIRSNMGEASLDDLAYIGEAIGFRRGYAAALRGEPAPESDED